MLNFDSIWDWIEERRRDVIAYAFKMYERFEHTFLDKKGRLKKPSLGGILKSEEPPPKRECKVPDGVCVYAVGDVHGRADLLRKLIQNIEKDVAVRNQPSTRNAIVFLGDYIDRGFESRQVIDMLENSTLEGFDLRFLKGNHEETLLNFLKDPSVGASWAQYGGIETLVSYNVKPPVNREDPLEWLRVQQEFAENLPESHLKFLNELEMVLTLGDYVFVHAGLRPGYEIKDQVDSDLLWIREEFLESKKGFDKLVVHGHTPVTEPHQDHRRISVDTGAYMTGRLTAVRLLKNTTHFIST